MLELLSNLLLFFMAIWMKSILFRKLWFEQRTVIILYISYLLQDFFKQELTFISKFIGTVQNKPLFSLLSQKKMSESQI